MSRSAAVNGGHTKASWLREHIVTIILLAVLIFGLGLLVYPTFSNWWNGLHQSRAIMGYARTVADMDEQAYDQLIANARAYNERLADSGEIWQMDDAQKAEYDSLLDVQGTGVMGYITIPKINVQLPIYHGTDDAVLSSSIGHLAGTSLPVGGPSTHTVLSGHRGLPSARLFSDLDQLVEGDTFTLVVLNETLTYEVDQIRIVEPTDISDLQIEPGKDLCTLVTCTPYGINTHRLLVRGHRIDNPNGDAQIIAEAVQVRKEMVAFAVAIPIIVILIIVVLIHSACRSRVRNLEDDYLQGMSLQRPRGSATDAGGHRGSHPPEV